MITKDKFKRYREVQESGVTNMLDIETVSRFLGLQGDEIKEIIKNYSKYFKKFEGKNE